MGLESMVANHLPSPLPPIRISKHLHDAIPTIPVWSLPSAVRSGVSDHQIPAIFSPSPGIPQHSKSSQFGVGLGDLL